MVCPNCKLVSLEGTEQCDCGYDFRTGRVDAQAADAARPRGDGLLAGFGIGFLLNMVGAVIVIANHLVLASVFFGLTQLLWIVPACIMLLRKYRKQTMKGVIILAGITFLLDLPLAGCWFMIKGLKP